MRIWFKRPGWYPADLQPHHSTDPTPWRAPAKYDPPASAFTRTYIFVQFWLLTAASLWLLSVHQGLPRAFVLLAFAWFCFSLFVQGLWLEGRRYARQLEWLRLGLTVAFGLAAHLLWRELSMQLILAVAGYALLSGFFMTVEHFLPSAPLTSP